MLTLNNVRNKAYMVMGLGLSGTSICKSLSHSGARIFAWDDTAQSRDEAHQQGIQITNLDDIPWSEITALILAPGIAHHLPYAHPAALKANQAHIPIICDIELLFSERLPATTVGITGSNGKSTTTALIHHVLSTQDRPVQIGGNIGIPVGDLKLLNDQGIYILELSSFQLERIPSLDLDIAVLTNITADHLERHGDMTGYLQAKQQIFKNHNKLQTAIIGIDDEYSLQAYETLRTSPIRNVIPVSTRQALDYGIYVKNNCLYDNVYAPDQQLFHLSDFNGLKGYHNWQNILHAYTVLRTLGVAVHDIYKAILTFKGLPHRLQSLGFINNIEFINDSKATNPDAVSYALAVCDNIYWILGGIAKESELNGLDVYYNRIKGTFVIGAASQRFAEILAPDLPVMQCNDLKHAVQCAFNAASQNNTSGQSRVVLLAPACASYDQFKNFEERGRKFSQYYEELCKNYGILENDYNKDQL